MTLINPIKSSRFFFLSILFSLLLQSNSTKAQDHSSTILNSICDMEGNKDPKCHATASRLEDFMYGTPLSFQARSQRINIQKLYVTDIWRKYTNLEKPENNLSDFKKIEADFLTFIKSKEGINVAFKNGEKIFITERDYRQYSSVAYALRAILSIDQASIFSEERFTPLGEEVLIAFKESLDIFIIALLQQSDKIARKNNAQQIEEVHINQALKELLPQIIKTEKIATNNDINKNYSDNLIKNIIDNKLKSYQKYNQISQAVFLRNIQVYFSKIKWPTQANESNDLKNYFTESTIGFTISVLEESLNKSSDKNIIEYNDVYHSVMELMPHTLNSFEDVIYFHHLDPDNRIIIESYDLDAFRDSGLHWQYLKFALEDLSEKLDKPIDPFALEMCTEAIAQFGVLILRMAGEDAINKNQNTLEINNINYALDLYQIKKSEHFKKKGNKNKKENILSVENKNNTISNQLFTNENETVKLSFEHRNSDWLNRLIRGFVFKEDENLARLSIPPAFGGGGVATEDLDNDGWIDVVLLGGKGNKVLKNNHGKFFTDITSESGLDWKRDDGTYGEARQPIVADFDNDGLQDIFISYANDDHRIYKNKGKGVFEDMTSTALLGGKDKIGGPCTALDYDNDGDLDIYIGYFGNYAQGILPTIKRHNTNGEKNVLFKNEGNFIFKDVSENSGLENSGWTQAVGHSDINGDGWQDIIVGNDFGVNAYYINQKDGTFKDISKNIGTDKVSYTMNIGIGDLNHDLLPDFYISNIVVMEKDDKYVLPNEDTPAHFDPSSLASMRVVEANDLFISNKEDNQITYSLSENKGRGYSSTGWSWDADFFDYDNDGDEDLYCLTGMNQYSVYGRDNEYYTSADGNKKDVYYADSKNEYNILFENKNGGLVQSGEQGIGLNFKGTSRSAAYFDFDKDGDLDIIINDYQESAHFFKNHTEKNKNNWAMINLIGNPKENVSLDAIGAKLIITLSDGTQLWREIHSTTGYLSVHPKNTHFGLGTNTTFDLEIQWPNGEIQIEKELNSNKFHQFQLK